MGYLFTLCRINSVYICIDVGFPIKLPYYSIYSSIKKDFSLTESLTIYLYCNQSMLYYQVSSQNEFVFEMNIISVLVVKLLYGDDYNVLCLGELLRNLWQSTRTNLFGQLFIRSPLENYISWVTDETTTNKDLNRGLISTRKIPIYHLNHLVEEINTNIAEFDSQRTRKINWINRSFKVRKLHTLISQCIDIF